MAENLSGSCQCGELQFQLQEQPLFVHACHCLDCKRKTGTSFGLTCIVLEQDIRIAQGETHSHQESPRTTAHICSLCKTPIYKTTIAHALTARLQTNCLEDLRLLGVGAHIWVKRKDPWLQLPEDVPQFEEAYDRDEVWPESSIQRVENALSG